MFSSGSSMCLLFFASLKYVHVLSLKEDSLHASFIFGVEYLPILCLCAMSRREPCSPLKWLLTQIFDKTVTQASTGGKIFDVEEDNIEKVLTLEKSSKRTEKEDPFPLDNFKPKKLYCIFISFGCLNELYFKGRTSATFPQSSLNLLTAFEKTIPKSIVPGETEVFSSVSPFLAVFENKMVSGPFCESTYDELCNELTKRSLDGETGKAFHSKSERLHRKTKKSNIIAQKNTKVDRGPSWEDNEEDRAKSSSFSDQEDSGENRNRLCLTQSDGSDTGYSSRCSTPPSPVTFGDSSQNLPVEKVLNEFLESAVREKNELSRSPSPSACSSSSSSSSDGETKDQRLDNQNGYSNKYNYRKPNQVQNFGYKTNGCLRQNTRAHGPEYPSVRGHSNYCKYEKRSSNIIYRGGGSHFTYQSYRDNSEKNHMNHSKKKFSDLFYQYVSQADVRECWGPYKRKLNGPAGKFSSLKMPKANDWKIPLFKDIEDYPDKLLDGSEWDDLSTQIWDMFIKNQQKFSTFKAKIQLKDRIAAVIHNILPTSHLFVVGSSLSGFGSNSSDVDMCLMVTERRLDQRNDAQHILKLLQRELNNCGFVENMVLICAKVPIIRFRDSQTGFEVDLNCNNSVGIRNTHLLNAYSQLDWRVRPLVLVAKLWARRNEIDNAHKQTISSYSLVLMVIHYLQSGVTPSLLPCLHKAFPDKFNPFNYIFTMPATEKLPQFTSKNEQSLGELFVGFLNYYAHIFRYNDQAISVRNGTTMSVYTCMFNDTYWNDSRMWNFLCIEEPFDLTNTASAVYDPAVFSLVKSVFQKSHGCLSKEKDLLMLFPVDSNN